MSVSKSRLRLCITLLVLNILFIWGNSLLPASVSAAFSGWMKDVLGWLLGMAGDSGAGGHGLLRKIAHLTEFACLGLCLSWLVRMLRTKKAEWYLLPLLAGFLTACVDETIQLFVPGRGPGIKDVGIDTLGVALGIVIISLIQYFKKKNLEDNNL